MLVYFIQLVLIKENCVLLPEACTVLLLSIRLNDVLNEEVIGVCITICSGKTNSSNIEAVLISFNISVKTIDWTPFCILVDCSISDTEPKKYNLLGSSIYVPVILLPFT